MEVSTLRACLKSSIRFRDYPYSWDLGTLLSFRRIQTTLEVFPTQTTAAYTPPIRKTHDSLRPPKTSSWADLYASSLHIILHVSAAPQSRTRDAARVRVRRSRRFAPLCFRLPTITLITCRKRVYRRNPLTIYDNLIRPFQTSVEGASVRIYIYIVVLYGARSKGEKATAYRRAGGGICAHIKSALYWNPLAEKTVIWKLKPGRVDRLISERLECLR